MTHSRAYWLTCTVAFLAVAASATTIILPTDAQLIAKSPVIVEGMVLKTGPIDGNGKIWTETTLSVERTLNVWSGFASANIKYAYAGREAGPRGV